MRQKDIGRVGVLCSGGDAPGMNAAIRAIVRTGVFHRLEVLGIRGGYRGLIEDDLCPLSLRSVGNLIQRGGTFLGSSRCPEFFSKKGRAQAYEVLKRYQINKLIVLGGDGSMKGASLLSREHPIKVIGVPCTIDNDLVGSDFSIGFDTAVETAVSAIDKIRDTADSHGRVFMIEVMGKNTGHIAIETALAVGAEFVVIPEEPFRKDQLVKKILGGIQRGKTGSIVIVAERNQPGFVLSLAKELQKKLPVDLRAMILGHLQRGGSPTAFDRNLASMFGAYAVKSILAGENRKMTAISCKKMRLVDFSSLVGKKKPAPKTNLRLIDQLSI